jgi:hypothetical protein
MLSVTGDDVVRMKDALFFDGQQSRRKLTKFWTLLPLAAVIATAGITSNSTATVIGAMIVAPLMTPILGTAFVLFMAVPLGVSGVQLYRQTMVVAEATPIAQHWAQQQRWQVTDVQFRAGDLWITAAGPAPNIDPASLRRDLTAAGLGDVTLEVQLLDGGIQQVPAS